MKPQSCIKGQPVSLHVLDYGEFRVNSGPRDIGIVGFLIKTNASEHILIDTGFPRKYADDGAAASTEDRLYEFGEVLTCTHRNMPERQLALAGSALDRVTLMIQTHTHIDHVGHIDACPQAPILIAAAERRLPRPLYWGDVQPLDWPERDYIEVEADVEIGPDLKVLLCPGHAPGQLAVFLRLQETGPVLLTSDAISRPAEVDEKFVGSWDKKQAIHHGNRLMNLAAESKALIIYGHCPEQWKTLRKAPESYT